MTNELAQLQNRNAVDHRSKFLSLNSILEFSVMRVGGRLEFGNMKHPVTLQKPLPANPHFGGIWEAAVKSMKYHLKRTIGEYKLSFEE